jgi:hypothetical protein
MHGVGFYFTMPVKGQTAAWLIFCLRYQRPLASRVQNKWIT